MRLRSIFKHALVASVAIFSLQSCDNDDDYDYSLMFPNALVTVKTDANDTFLKRLQILRKVSARLYTSTG